MGRATRGWWWCDATRCATLVFERKTGSAVGGCVSCKAKSRRAAEGRGSAACSVQCAGDGGVVWCTRRLWLERLSSEEAAGISCGVVSVSTLTWQLEREVERRGRRRPGPCFETQGTSIGNIRQCRIRFRAPLILGPPRRSVVVLAFTVQPFSESLKVSRRRKKERALQK